MGVYLKKQKSIYICANYMFLWENLRSFCCGCGGLLSSNLLKLSADWIIHVFYFEWQVRASVISRLCGTVQFLCCPISYQTFGVTRRNAKSSRKFWRHSFKMKQGIVLFQHGVPLCVVYLYFGIALMFIFFFLMRWWRELNLNLIQSN